MPGHARIDKGEGLIRSHDLFEVLGSDVDVAYRALEADRSSQFLRRCVVRANFSFIEAAIECVKVELRSAVRLRMFPDASLSEKERETLGSLAIVGVPPGKFLPLDDNIKRTFKLAAKVWHLDFRLATGGEEFRCFKASKLARNRLTHPRTVYDVEVTDDDMHYHSVTIIWVRAEFQRLFKARVQSLVKALSDKDRQRLLLGTMFADGSGA